MGYAARPEGPPGLTGRGGGTVDWTVGKLIEATKGTLIQGSADQAVADISTDSRHLNAGDCFVALLGERHDGHAFIPDVLAKKAGALILSDVGCAASVAKSETIPVIVVDNTLDALGCIAGYYRQSHPVPVVGVTGSNGKTSTKEMIAEILGQVWSVRKTQGNFNNLIGVPLTILGLRPHHQAAVVEMGINVPGEMTRLVEMCKPTVGVITNIQPAHLEGLHSLDEILAEKGNLWLSLNSDGIAIVNADDGRLSSFGQNVAARKIRFSVQGNDAEVFVSGSIVSREGRLLFDLQTPTAVVPIELHALGLHHASNAVAAAAAATALRIPPEVIARGLKAFRPMRMRMQLHHLDDGRVLVDDTYNANPGSMLAALRTVQKESRGMPVVAVLGDMKELGVQSPLLHREVGRQLPVLGIRELITLGEIAQEIGLGAVEAGMESSSCLHALSHEEIVHRLKTRPIPRSWVLVKGSRSMAMERVVEGILAS